MGLPFSEDFGIGTIDDHFLERGKNPVLMLMLKIMANFWFSYTLYGFLEHSSKDLVRARSFRSVYQFQQHRGVDFAL